MFYNILIISYTWCRLNVRHPGKTMIPTLKLGYDRWHLSKTITRFDEMLRFGRPDEGGYGRVVKGASASEPLLFH